MSVHEDSESLAFKECKGETARRFYARYGRKLRVSRLDYQLIPCEELRLGRNDCFGICDPEEQKLYIRMGSETAVTETLLHELVHAELSECGIKQHPKWCMELEEIVAEVLSKAIASQFKLKRVGPRTRR